MNFLNLFIDILNIKHNKMDCPICLEIIGETNCMVTSCGHKFHSNCIITAVMQSGRSDCPCCRRNMNANVELERKIDSV
jgi:hypothetical protein